MSDLLLRLSNFSDMVMKGALEVSFGGFFANTLYDGGLFSQMRTGDMPFDPSNTPTFFMTSMGSNVEYRVWVIEGLPDLSAFYVRIQVRDDVNPGTEEWWLMTLTPYDCGQTIIHASAGWPQPTS